MPEERAEKQHLQDLIRGFETAMLVTHGEGGRMQARPLAIAAARDGRLHFATAIDSPKVSQLQADPRVTVVLQDAKRFVSLNGRARVSTDRRLSDELWSEAWKVWFPGGKGDASLCILIVEPEEAEYWDRSGLEGLKYLFQAAKAYLQGTEPALEDGESHAKLKV